MQTPKPILIAQTQPGFEQIVANQIARIEGVRLRDTRTVADKNGMLRFSFDGDYADLLELRSIEDLFIQVAGLRELPPVFAGLRSLRDAALETSFDQALSIARTIRPGAGGAGKLRFRVVTRLAYQASYRRIDAQEMVAKAIAARQDRRWQLADEGGLEFWLTLLTDPDSPTRQTEAILALRLTDEKTRHRAEKREHIPASLRPAAAAALVTLTKPRPADLFLDPMCGAGTLLIERALAGRYAQLIGGDLDERALAAANKNIGSKYQPIELHSWDARELPIEAGTVSACAVNLPFGRQLGSPEQNRALYPAVLREVTRVLCPQARFVALTGDTRGFERAFERTAGLVAVESYPVMVLGANAKVYVAQRV